MSCASRLSAIVLAALATGSVVPIAAAATTAVKAVLVEQVIPSRAFSQKVEVSQYRPGALFGPGTGTFGIASITLTNRASIAQNIIFTQAVVDSATGQCSLSTFRKGPDVAEVYVAPRATLHLDYPQSLVLQPFENVNCVLVRIQGDIGDQSVMVQVTGLVN